MPLKTKRTKKKTKQSKKQTQKQTQGTKISININSKNKNKRPSKQPQQRPMPMPLLGPGMPTPVNVYLTSSFPNMLGGQIPDAKPIQIPANVPIIGNPNNVGVPLGGPSWQPIPYPQNIPVGMPPIPQNIPVGMPSNPIVPQGIPVGTPSPLSSIAGSGFDGFQTVNPSPGELVSYNRLQDRLGSIPINILEAVNEEPGKMSQIVEETESVLSSAKQHSGPEVKVISKEAGEEYHSLKAAPVKEEIVEEVEGGGYSTEKLATLNSGLKEWLRESPKKERPKIKKRLINFALRNNLITEDEEKELSKKGGGSNIRKTGKKIINKLLSDYDVNEEEAQKQLEKIMFPKGRPQRNEDDEPLIKAAR